MTAGKEFFRWELTAIHADDSSTQIAAWISSPYYSEEPFASWRCDYAVGDEDMQGFPAFGASPLQALALGLGMIRQHLELRLETQRLLDATTGESLIPGTFTSEIFDVKVERSMLES